jgi:hypothetical protein
MTPGELLEKFQAKMPVCFFCKCPHGGEGYEGYRMQDVVDGIDLGDLAYICPGCQPRRPEFNRIIARRKRSYDHIEDLRELGLYDFDEKYKLSEVDSVLRDGNPKVFEVLDEYPLPSNVWLHGQCGIGKSHVCRAIGNRYAYRLKSVASITGPRLSVLAENYGQQHASSVEPYETADLLIVDDIDKALAWTKRGLQTLWMIADTRERTKKRTVITSQLTPTAFFGGLDLVAGPENKFSLSLLDRLKPLSVFEFKGRPRRGVQ